MCKDCALKAVEIDQRVPHFIDRYGGNPHGEGMPDSIYVPARKELWDYMKAKHGRIVQL